MAQLTVPINVNLPENWLDLVIERVKQDGDFVLVTRCKDCKHYEFADNRAFGMPVKYCDWFGFEDVDDYDFCSRAERREDG